VYDDYDEEEIGEAEFEIYKVNKDQVLAELANVQSARFWKDANKYNCANRLFYRPWSKDTSGCNPKRVGGAFTDDFRRKNRLSGSHYQILFHLMLYSMRLPALHT